MFEGFKKIKSYTNKLMSKFGIKRNNPQNDPNEDETLWDVFAHWFMHKVVDMDTVNYIVMGLYLLSILIGHMFLSAIPAAILMYLLRFVTGDEIQYLVIFIPVLVSTLMFWFYGAVRGEK